MVLIVSALAHEVRGMIDYHVMHGNICTGNETDADAGEPLGVERSIISCFFWTQG